MKYSIFATMINLLVFIQTVVQKLSQSTASLLKVLLMSRFTSKLPETNNKTLVILGNGPSLNYFLNEKKTFLKNKDVLAVNHFANTAIYEQIRPNFYILNIPEFWTDNVDNDVIKRRDKLIEDLINKTDWQLNLLLGVGAKQSKNWKNISKKNPNIHIYYFNTTPIEGFTWFKHFCFRRNCGMPRPHNVLIPSLMLGINMKYQNIYITGADHSWMQELFVADDNTVYLTQKHFYDEKSAKPDVMKKTGKGKRKMHEILIKFVLSFSGYHTIRKYADKQGITIKNITPNSMIDAFEREKL